MSFLETPFLIDWSYIRWYKKLFFLGASLRLREIFDFRIFPYNNEKSLANNNIIFIIDT